MIEIEKFKEKHIEDAARLFSISYKDLRKIVPRLPQKYENLEIILPQIEEIIEENPAVVAISKDEVIGYMCGFHKLPNFKSRYFGVYIPEWAHAVATFAPKENAYNEMYKYLAKIWISEECFVHAITFFSNDEILKEYSYWSGFGLLVVDAIRNTNPICSDFCNDIVVRELDIDEIEDMFFLDKELNRYLSNSPTFLCRRNKEGEAIKKEFINDNAYCVVAEKNGKIVSCIRGTDEKYDGCDIVKDTSIMGIDFAYTIPPIRGTGVGSQLLNEILEWGKMRNKTGCAVDFESANILSRYFWMKHFEPVCYSSIRFVDERVA